MSPAELSRRLRDRAREFGFDAVGIARASALERDGAALNRWLDAGQHGSMNWMERDPAQRADPTRVLEGCRSVVALAMNYHTGSAGDPPAGSARVARYAHGRDYHKVMRKRTRALAEWLEAETDGASRTFVDTGPVLERAWAEQAGIGWIGKNANLISRSLGSWLLLSEVLTTAELEVDDGPHDEFCGSCNACIEACPTDAIVADGVVDSNRCISFWTIERRGEIDPALRNGIGDWIFGCDDCQTVCPWNLSFGVPREDDPFAFREDLRGLDPLEILAMDESTFRLRYSGTSLMRAKWEGMRRNAAVVLGNRRDPASIPALGRALEDPDPTFRCHVIWALGEHDDPSSTSLLEGRIGGESDPSVRDEITAALERIRRRGRNA
ncbi:hypothetical protein ABI59_19640 [Acidobacteria bacterium Mor1]|nr:hypothetical protein ABI59_19640 [Acidobacteria bacterium Mor1]